MPDFPAYTEAELEQLAKDHHRVRTPGADVGYGSDYHLRSAALARIANAFKVSGQTALRVLSELTAFGVFLRGHAANHAIGANLLETVVAGQRARGKVILQAGGTGLVQGAGSTLIHADGTAYTLD